MFNPKNSSTYSDLLCAARQLTLALVNRKTHVVIVTARYGDQSLTHGVLAREMITLSSDTGKAAALESFVFGCGQNNTGSFNQDDMGLIRLGGPLSLISQIGSKLGGRKLSHCLVPFHTSPSVESKMSFGSRSDVSGGGMVTTPLVSKQDKTPYFVTMEGITVGKKLVPFNSSRQVSEGNMFLDPGTPPTLVPQGFYNRLAAEVKSQIPMAPIIDDKSLGPPLCYRSQTNLQGTMLTMHFKGGSTVQLTPTETFIPPKDGVFCFAMKGVASDGGVFAQSNFLIGFDLEKMTVSFEATDCTAE